MNLVAFDVVLMVSLFLNGHTYYCFRLFVLVWKDSEVFDVFDENLKLIGQEKRLVVHTKGLFHQATHVLIFNEDGKSVLIQKRSSKKRIGPNQWDLSCAEHLQPGESQESAAIRGMEEELNLKMDKGRLFINICVSFF